MQDTYQERQFLTVRELGELLRVSRTRAYQLVAAGDVPSVRIGGLLRIPRAELDKQLAAATRTSAA